MTLSDSMNLTPPSFRKHVQKWLEVDEIRHSCGLDFLGLERKLDDALLCGTEVRETT